MYRVMANNLSSNDDIQFLFDIIDKNKPIIIQDIMTFIYDYRTALQAKQFYNKEWFQNQLLSVDAKCAIADLLRQQCTKYRVTSVFWDLINSADPEVLQQIDILQNKENFRKNLGE